MNKKGFMATASVLIALMVSGMFIASLQPLVMNKAKISKDVEMFTQEKVNTRNGLERLFSMYSDDISSGNSVISYDDLGINYNIEEIDINYRPIRRFVMSGDIFRINNETSLIINFDGSKIIAEDDAYIDLEISVNDLFEENQYHAPVHSERIFLGSYWQKEIDINGYGDYQISYSSNNIRNLNIGIEYTEQSYRKLKIIENGIKERILIIENDVINKKMNKYLEL